MTDLFFLTVSKQDLQLLLVFRIFSSFRICEAVLVVFQYWISHISVRDLILQVRGEDGGNRDCPHQHSDRHKCERSAGLRHLHLHRSQQHGKRHSRHPAPQHQYVQTGSEHFIRLKRSASPDWSRYLLLTPIERWWWISINVWINKNAINENKQTSASGCRISYRRLINAHKDDEQNHERDFCPAMRFCFSRPEQQLWY